MNESTYDPNTDRELILDLLRRESAIFEPRSKTRPPVRPVVYYIRWSDRIKIGYTSRLAERLRGLYYDEVLAAEPGSLTLERQRHRQFDSIRREGQREWFSDAAPLRFHINTIRDKYPELVRSFAK